VKSFYDLLGKAILSSKIKTVRCFSVTGIFVVFVLLFLSSQVLMAAGIMKGKVFDKETKDELPGANILVKGTSIGAATDVNGAYSIPNAPVGKQTIEISYIGYQPASVEVDIPESGTINQDFYLEPTTIQGKTVLVTAQAQGQVEAINQQLSSNKIVNVVSEAKIQELPDFNAAEAIGRLPGVSTQQSSGEADKIVVRGLAPQFNEVAIGGITLASTGSTTIGATSLGLTASTGNRVSDDRSVDLTMITPYMIKSIELYKSLTPDMQANAIGGYVNMELREAPSGFHGDMLWQSGYTQKSNTYGNYRAIASASDRFFDDQFGVYVLGDAEQYDRSADNLTASYGTASSTVSSSGYRPVLVSGVTLNRHIETRERFGGNMILDYKLPSGSIQSVNTFNRLNEDYQNYNTVLDYSNVVNKDLQFNYGQGLSHTDLALNSLNVKNDFGFMSAELEAANSYSRNHLPYSPYYNFQQNGPLTGFTTADTNITPENLAHFVKYGPDSTTQLLSMSLFKSDYHENDQAYKADFKIPLSVGTSVSGFFKLGGEYRYNYITNDQSTPYIQLNGSSDASNTNVRNLLSSLYPNLRYYGGTGYLEGANFTSNNSKLLESFLSNKFGAMYWVPNTTIPNGIVDYIQAHSSQFAPLQSDATGGGWFDGPYQELTNDYKYIERYYATYLMSELDFGPDLMVVGGARYEETKGLYFVYNMQDARNPSIQPYATNTVYPENHYWLPQVQAKYNINEWSDIRYSYTQTLARPDYTQLSPHYDITAGGGTPNVYAGNPNLKPAQAYNHDVELTLHSNDLGLLSIGGFYKEVNHFTFSTSYKLHSKTFYEQHGVTGLDSLNSFSPYVPPDGSTVYTYINSPYIAYVRGIEVDLQTRFWYLPAPFNGVVLGINYSRISSRATYPFIQEIQAGRNVVILDSTKTDRLIYQPNDIMNSYIGYDYAGFSGRLSFLFQGNVITNIGNYLEQEGFSKNYFRIDAQATQHLPWAKGLELYLDVNNLNSESNISTQPSIGGFTLEQYYGLTADLGIRYTL
jgi:TonB-dependent receptor